jgi:hypothetical protein
LLATEGRAAAPQPRSTSSLQLTAKICAKSRLFLVYRYVEAPRKIESALLPAGRPCGGERHSRLSMDRMAFLPASI